MVILYHNFGSSARRPRQHRRSRTRTGLQAIRTSQAAPFSAQSPGSDRGPLWRQQAMPQEFTRQFFHPIYTITKNLIEYISLNIKSRFAKANRANRDGTPRWLLQGSSMGRRGNPKEKSSKGLPVLTRTERFRLSGIVPSCCTQ